MQSKQQEKDNGLTAENCMAVEGMKLNNSSRLVGKEERISEWTYVTVRNFLNMPGACLTYPL